MLAASMARPASEGRSKTIANSYSRGDINPLLASTKIKPFRIVVDAEAASNLAVMMVFRAALDLRPVVAMDCLTAMLELVQSIFKHKISKKRYGHAGIVQIPKEQLEKIRAANRIRCERDSLMPSCSNAIEYVALTKTHFTHACRLFEQAARTFFNRPGSRQIRLQENDKEG